MKKQPKIKAVTAAPAFAVSIAWSTASRVDRIDLKDLIRSLKGLAPLRNRDLFKQVRVKEWGWAIEWPWRGSEIDIGADTLRRLALEQNGEAMPAAAFHGWRTSHDLSHADAARELGLSRRMVIYYDQGARPIPKTVWLATKGYDKSSSGRPPGLSSPPSRTPTRSRRRRIGSDG